MNDKLFIDTFPVSPFMMNAVVLGCRVSGNAAIIDPGDEPERLLGVVESEGLEVSHILLTHGHVDHVAAVREVHEATGAPIHLHAADLPLYERVADQARAFGLRFDTELPPVDHELSDGEVIEIGELKVEVRHAPGHSPGSVCFVVSGAPGVVVSGDVLFAGSIGRTDLWGGSYQQLMTSIRTKLMPLDDATLVYSGHGPISTIGDERQTNPFRHDFLPKE